MGDINYIKPSFITGELRTKKLNKKKHKTVKLRIAEHLKNINKL
jgi:hypothetical protein